MPVWGLRSTNDHRGDSEEIRSYGGHSVDAATESSGKRNAIGPIENGSYEQKAVPVPIGNLIALNDEVEF
jgi:hypothetical protein